MTKQEIAFHIFLKRLPNEFLTDKNESWIKSRAEEAVKLAEIFEAACPHEPMFSYPEFENVLGEQDSGLEVEE